MPPGVALCEACPDLWLHGVPPLDPEEGEGNILCGNESDPLEDHDDAWWFLDGKDAADLAACCEDTVNDEDVQEACQAFSELTHEDSITGENLQWIEDAPEAARRSCLYNYVVQCMEIYDSGDYTPPNYPYLGPYSMARPWIEV